MKLISNYGQIIDVQEEHAAMLIGQKVWKPYKEEKDGLQDKREETPKEVTQPVKRGRTK